MTDVRATNRRQWIYIVTPFLLLILCIGFINLLSGRVTSTAQSTPTATGTLASLPYPSATQPIATPLPTNSPTPSSPATMTTSTETPTPTATPTPPFPPGSQVQLLGPPPDSSFPMDANLSFYWTWPFPLTQGDRFALYVAVDGQEHLVGEVDRPNVGRAYHLQTTMSEFVERPGTVQWMVKLRGGVSNLALVESEIRSVTLEATP